MTTVTAPRIVCALDARDKAILLAVWRAYVDMRGLTVRDFRPVMGVNSPSTIFRCLRRLCAQGWLMQGPHRGRTLRPGPRFGGVLRNKTTGEETVLEVLPL